MLEVPVPTKACWTAEAARLVFRTEALEGDEAVFLATHTPIRDFNVLGSSGGDIQSASEQGLLEALSATERRHAFCAVQGEPGSGKSHLIRWLYVNWPTGRDLPLLLQRSDGSLEGALRQLQARLPAEFAPLFERIGQRQKATVDGRAAVFHNTLAALLDPNHYDPPLEDRDWCQHWQPAALLYSMAVARGWQAPKRILKLVSGGDGERNSATARFDVFDVADLAELASEGGAKAGVANALLWRLRKEADDTIEPARQAGRAAEDVARENAAAIPLSLELVRALNRRKNDAIQNVLGVSAEGLKSLFREVRQVLAKRGTRLVLLLEDITSWEGLDDSLIDVLVTNADTRGSGEDADLCDLVSVVGLTPEYYRTLRPNYRQRITHEVRLGDDEGGLQDVVTVRDPERRLRFVARYLAATRAGPDRLRAWRETTREDTSLTPPNACDMCPLREGCHPAFGAVDGVGLFPFTENAIGGFYEALKTDDNGMTWKTPRGIIQAVLSPTLGQPEVIDNGRYPGPEVERTTFEDDKRRLQPGAMRMIEAAVEDSRDQARMRRLLAFWGAWGRTETTRRADGMLAFHNVPRPVFEAFVLPWLGGEVGARTAAPATRPAPPQAIEDKPAPVEPTVHEGRSGERVAAPDDPVAEPAEKRATEEPTRAPRVQRVTLDAEEIRAWRDGAKLKSPSAWNKALYDFIQTIDPRRVDADPWVWEKYFTPELVKIEGTGQERRYHFVLPKTAWLMDGLEAWATLNGRSTPPDHEIELYHAQIARMARHLEAATRRFLDARLGTLPDGRRWDPAAAAAQVLLVRAWLRRAALPTDPTEKQWATILSDEAGADSAPRARTPSWQSLLEGSNKRHGELRDMLRAMISTPQGGGRGFGLAGGQAARAVMALARDLCVIDVIAEPPAQHSATEAIQVVAALATRTAETLPQMLSNETRLLRDRAERVATLLRGLSLQAHVQRLDAAIAQADQMLPSVANDRVRAWRQHYERLLPLLQNAEERQSVENTVLDFTDTDEPPPTPVRLLSKLVTARAGLLDQCREALSAGEAAVEALVVHVSRTVQANPTVGGLTAIQEKGRQLLDAARAAEERLIGQEAA